MANAEGEEDLIPPMECGRLLLGFMLWAAAVTVQAATTPLAIVATTAEMKSLAEEVGGKHVRVSSLVPAGADPENYQPHVSDLERLKSAALVIRVGADYDLWLDRLLAQVRRPELRRGGAAHVDASFAVALLDVRGASLGQSGHAHGSGNPHYWLDPQNADIITGNIAEALIRHDPVHAREYERQRLAFLDRLAARQRDWERRLAPFAGRPLLAYHNTWAYFARRFRLNFAGYLEIKPGVPPSPAHMAGLLKRMRDERITLIVRQPTDPARDADYLARRGDARVVELAASVGALPEVRDYLSLFDVNVARLATAFSENQ